jgi:intein/homing endonuclease
MSRKSTELLNREDELIRDAWLGIDKTADELFNPLETIPEGYEQQPHVYLLWLLSNPDHFALFCREILNITIHPIQAVILKELWVRKFPMLIGSRGMGKSFMLALYILLRMIFMPGRKIVMTGAGFRQSKLIFAYMEKIWDNAPLLRDIAGSGSGYFHGTDAFKFVIGLSEAYALPIGDGCLTEDNLITMSDGIYNISLGNTSGIVNHEKYVWSSADKKFVYSDESYNNGKQKTKKITTKRGYSIEGTHNHKLKVLRNNNIVWLRLDEMIVGDRILIDRSERWHNNTNNITKEEAYALGLMIGDGCWTNKYKLRFTSEDPELVEKLELGTKLKFKQCSDLVHFDYNGIKDVNNWLDYWGLNVCYTIDKIIPHKVLTCSKDVVSSLISGLFDTDGHVQVNKDKGGVSVCLGFTNTSKKLVDQLHYLLLHFGIISTKSSRLRGNENWNRVYELHIYGNNAKLFQQRINFCLSRKKIELETALSEKSTFNSMDDEIPNIQKLMLESIKEIKIVKNGSRSARARVLPSKIKNKKTITFHYLQTFLEVYKNNTHYNMDILKSLADNDIYYDTIDMIEDGENCTYDIHVPNTHEYCANGFFSHNSKIRGYRAHDIIVDEFAVGNPEILEHVIFGFAVVSADPIGSNQRKASIRKAIELGRTIDNDDDLYQANQIIVSGTAYYEFNHFYKYWRKYQGIVNSRGDKKRLAEIGADPDKTNWRDYSVMRIPYYFMPEGFMEVDIIARAKNNMHQSLFDMEYLSLFSADSNGFFKRSLLEKCVANHNISLYGERGKEYVLGIDPASEEDNFSIVVLEIEKSVRRVVYCWTSTKQSYKEELKSGKAKENDFYDYVCRKILDLVDMFDVRGIAIDSQGGGHAIVGRLHNPSVLKQGEAPLWPIIDVDEPSEDDIQEGRHIIELISFADAKWTSEANHGMRLDFESRALLFPKFDGLTFAEIDLSTEEGVKTCDITEESVLEIEEMKNELSSIVMTQTPSGRDKWDTPDQKLPGQKKGRLRKDRYSALLMANYLGKKLVQDKREITYSFEGGLAKNIKPEEITGPAFTGTNAISMETAKKLNELYKYM